MKPLIFLLDQFHLSQVLSFQIYNKGKKKESENQKIMELQETKPKMTADKRILLDTIKVRIMDIKRGYRLQMTLYKGVT